MCVCTGGKGGREVACKCGFACVEGKGGRERCVCVCVCMCVVGEGVCVCVYRW